MTAPRTSTRRAPGKLFITGEYAVMQPGSPAVLVAVDRLVAATVSAADGPGVVISSDLHPEPVRLHWDGTRLVGAGGFGHAIAALEVVAEFLAERGWPAPDLQLRIDSELHDGGTKFGLGSSGAVSVAVIDAALAYCGVGPTRDTRYRLAMIATARLDPRSSGADLAASTWGGWIEYRAPDRAAVLDLVARHGITAALAADWPGLAVRSLAVSPGLLLQVGWTGRPAATGALLGAGHWRGSPAHLDFVAAMAESVRATVDALAGADRSAVLAQIRTARRLLADLDRATGLGIFTDRLTALCDAADAAGGAGKPSGAGGGDCGIALLDTAAHPDLGRLRGSWAAAGVRHLPVEVTGVDMTSGEMDPQ